MLVIKNTIMEMNPFIGFASLLGVAGEEIIVLECKSTEISLIEKQRWINQKIIRKMKCHDAN